MTEEEQIIARRQDNCLMHRKTVPSWIQGQCAFCGLKRVEFEKQIAGMIWSPP